MARRNRRDVIDESRPGLYHVYTRINRRHFLLGQDPVTGADWSVRKGWIRRRMELLAQIFLIDVHEFAILDNHFHSILRNRPDLVEPLSDREVAKRWLQLNRASLLLNGVPSEQLIDEFVKDVRLVQKARQRLSSISEFMGYLKEPIAREANIQDEAPGHFWGARFSAVPLPNDASLQACSLYVVLNTIRAGKAEKVEDAEFTSLHARLQDQLSKDPARSLSGWLAPVHVDGDGYDGMAAGRRASNKGYLNVPFAQQLELADAVATHEKRQKEVRQKLKPGEMVVEQPLALPPVLERLGVNADEWDFAMRVTSRRFNRELEIMASMFAEAHRRAKERGGGSSRSG
ncbi:MAG: transposase [Planctomycetota bacterium]